MSTHLLQLARFFLLCAGRPNVTTIKINSAFIYFHRVVLGSGVGPFLYKLIIIHYGATRALAGIGVGMIVGISSSCGVLIGKYPICFIISYQNVLSLSYFYVF